LYYALLAGPGLPDFLDKKIKIYKKYQNYVFGYEYIPSGNPEMDRA
jgi:hypothetical protein